MKWFKRASSLETLIQAALPISADESRVGSLSDGAKRELCEMAWSDLTPSERKLCSKLRGRALAQVALAGSLTYGFSPLFNARRQACRMLMASQDHFALCAQSHHRAYFFYAAAALVASACAIETLAPWSVGTRSMALSVLAMCFCSVAVAQSNAAGGWSGSSSQESKAHWLAKKYWPALKSLYLSDAPERAFGGLQKIYSLTAPYTLLNDERKDLPPADSLEWIESWAQKKELERSLDLNEGAGGARAPRRL